MKPSGTGFFFYITVFISVLVTDLLTVSIYLWFSLEKLCISEKCISEKLCISETLSVSSRLSITLA